MATQRWRRATVPVALLTAALTVLVPAMPVTAAQSPAQSASLGDLTFSAVATSHSSRTATGRAVLTVQDTSLYTPPVLPATQGVGMGPGWHVTEQASVLAYSGPNHGTAIPAANLAIVSVEAPAAVSGQPVDPVNGPMTPASPTGTLDSARMVLHAQAMYGAGKYTQGIVLSLTIPADTRAGTYTATITTTISTGP